MGGTPGVARAFQQHVSKSSRFGITALVSSPILWHFMLQESLQCKPAVFSLGRFHAWLLFFFDWSISINCQSSM